MDVIIDIDGTLADITHRLHWIKSEPKDWDAFYAACPRDEPIMPVIELVRLLDSSRKNRVIFCSGRPESSRKDTQEWLDKHVFGVLSSQPYEIYGDLYMRADGDFRPDHVIKLELLARMRADGFDPVLAIEDRQQVVDAWRGAGLICAQVAEGKY